ncbi:DNA-binding protein RFX5-like isoform X2 [Megalops cyprinoides]|uniref:DNA-binding protein RFX5-like isoform X2 n=1 Tax=Megalops cyprinoides TaxID=118141 RepID=UPI001864AA47|nr:DNA-binding protein RFX5-like isoform X2 [Megalops cyprinoides]
MTEDSLQTVTSKRGDLASGEGDTEPSMLLQKLKNNISKNVQTKVDSILQDVQRFSDNAKLYLYLQLPSGPGTGEKSSSDSGSWSSADQLHTCNWIRSHLEEHSDTCLPKQDVYETYKRYCDNLQYRPLSAANFGKIIRDIFPNIKARRLGGRGQSKYCYSGIRRRTVLNMPLLPNLDLKNDPSELTELVQTYNQEVMEAACELICDWAQKILKRSFDTVVEIARFLVQEHIVNPRCSQAELVTSTTLGESPARPLRAMKKSQTQQKDGNAESEGRGSENKKDKEGGEQASPSKPATTDKSAKAAESGRSGDRDLQVEAVMKRYPQLLPRGSIPDKTQLPIGSSPPTLMPKDTGGVKVTLPITMATLPQQQGGALPVFNMILPSGMSLSYPEKEKTTTVTMATAAPTPGVVQRGRGAPKRTPEPAAAEAAAGVGGTPPKKKRGRPRKPRPEEAGQPPPTTLQTSASLLGGVIQKALPSSSSSQQPQPQGQTQVHPEVMEIVIQDRQLLGALSSTLEVPPTVDAAGLSASSTPEHRGVVVQCSRSDNQPVQDTSQPALLLHAVGQPATPAAQSWEIGRAMVEVIKRAPITNQGGGISAAPAPALTSQPEDKQDAETILSPVDSFTEQSLASADPALSTDCPQPSVNTQVYTP